MPRPKRAKVAPSAPAAQPRRGRPPGPSRKPREASEAIESSQEQNIEQETQARATRGNAMVSGPSARSARLSASNTRVLEESKKRRDSAMSRLEAENEFDSSSGGPGDAVAQAPREILSSSPEVEIGRRGRVAASVESSAIIPGTFRRRARQPSILGRGQDIEIERSESVDSDIAQSQDITNVERPIGRVMSSGFKPRQRQPSILGNVRSSSVGVERDIGTPVNPGSALRTGVFRRRARQPSILGTPSHNPSRALPAEASDQDEQGEDDEEDDFDPEDESTPLNLLKSKPLDSSPQSTSPINSRKRKLSSPSASNSSNLLKSKPLDSSPQSASPINSRKRKLSSPSASNSSAALPPLEKSPSSALSPPPVSSPMNVRSQTPEITSSTHAPPHSSSSLRLSLTPPRRTRARSGIPSERTPGTRRQPSRAHAMDDDLPSSPPSLTHSPDNRPSVKNPAGKLKGKAAAKPEPASFSTAQLQLLLPRRRRRATRDAYEIGSSDESNAESDEDKLSHLAVASSRSNRRTPAQPKRVTKLQSAIKGKGKAVAAAQAAAAKQTYGSRRASAPSLSDKENGDNSAEVSEGEVDPDDSLAPVQDSIEDSSVLEERLGKELKIAKRKFEDVDQWVMEFEDMTANSSSPKDAR
ncbi:hypothetical protein V498_06859 [Pseudogymnoascus sp. VKM F-4517 (FW-2822)]|nr:hypothetical protein V498_06859 [Pseudogymnoascus sp. VKM F-4517 (FW-2822)]